MRRKLLVTAVTFLISMSALIALLSLTQRANSISTLAWGASLDAPAVTGVDPSSALNDLDTPIVITGTGFAAELTGTLVITPPTVRLGSITLPDAGWVSSTTLTATVPWGLAPGVYTLTVVNPDEQAGSLPNAFTATQGIGVWTTGGPYGGEVWDVVLHPMTSTWVYATAQFSGLFFSDDAAAHWRFMLLASPTSPGRLSFDAAMPGVMYFGITGGSAAYRTRDGGTTWDVILPNPLLHAINLVAHPISSGVVYAATSAPSWEPIAPGEEGGIYRSSDWGSTWVTITTGLTDTHVTSIAFHPQVPDTMLAGTRNGNVFASTNGGDSWNWVARLGSHVERLYFNPFGAHEAWAVATPPTGPAHPPFLYKGVGTDLTTWMPITVAGGAQVFSLAFHSTVSGTLWAAAGEGGYVSEDGGQNWSPLGSGPSMAFAVDPNNPNIMYAGTRGRGVFKSIDGGNTWEEANQGLAGVVPDYMAVSPNNPYEVYAHTQMGLIKTNNGGGSWRSLDVIRSGIAWARYPLAVDPFTSTRVYLGESWTPSGGAGPKQDGVPGIRISEDGGQSWRAVTWTVPSELNGWNGEVFAVAPHPSQPGRLLAGVTFQPPDFDWTYYRLSQGGFYASDDYGEHWAHLSPSQAISGVVQIVYDKINPQVVYAATGGTGLLKSSDGGQTWQSVPAWSATQNPDSVAVHPRDSNMVCVTEAGSVYVSRDAGNTWTKTTLFGYMYNLLFAPSDPTWLYAAGNGGVYRSADGQIWNQMTGVPRGADVHSLAADADEERVVVYIGSSGGLMPLGTQSAGMPGLTVESAEVTPGLGQVMGGGIYRMTSRQLKQRVYLPVTLKGYTP